MLTRHSIGVEFASRRTTKGATMTMSYTDYIFSEQFQKDLEADENFISDVVTALRDYSNYKFPERPRCIGTAIEAKGAELHDTYLDESGDEDGAVGESNEIDRQNVIEIRGCRD